MRYFVSCGSWQKRVGSVLTPMRNFHTNGALRMPRLLDVDIFADVAGPEFFVDGYSDTGVSVNGVDHVGGSIVLPEAHFLWRARSVADITIESLSPILCVDPKPSVLLLGTGRTLELPPN